MSQAQCLTKDQHSW